MVKFPLIISTVDEQLFHGEVYSCTCPGHEGELSILAHHEPLITTLKKGTIKVRGDREEVLEFPIERGLLEIAHNRATVLL